MSSHPLKVMHIASGDRWAGAEVQLFTLLTELHKMPDIEPRAILLNHGELAQRLQQQGVAVDIVDENTLSSPAIFMRLIKLLRQHRPDIVHTHRQKENILSCIANAISIRARAVRTVHGANEHPPQRLPQRLIHALDIWTGNHLQQRIIAVSQDLAQKLKHTFAAKNIVVIENGVDIDAVRASVRAAEFREKEPTTIHIGIVGRLDPVKRIDIFLDMVKLLADESTHQRWHFHIFGEGALLAELQQQSQQLGINALVTFHGHRTDIASCIAALDLLVMCSDHEGLPMTALESMTVGTPLVAHAVGELCLLLKDNCGGLSVTTHTAAGYANAVKNILAANKETLAAKGLDRIRENYSSQKNARRMTEMYRML